MEAQRDNKGKLKWSLLDYKSLEPMIEVLQQAYESEKYPKDNWKLGMKQDEILDSLQRHLAKLMDGIEFDEESGLHHIGHIMCNAMFYEFNRQKLRNEQNNSKDSSKE